MLPIVEANRAELVTSDHALNDHIRLTPTPGHTPDHFAVCAGRGGDQAVFTGDLIHSPIQARYPELVMRVDTDRDQAVATRRRFFERYCDTDTLCCTMHFPSPSVGHVKRWGDGFRLEYRGRPSSVPARSPTRPPNQHTSVGWPGGGAGRCRRRGGCPAALD